MVDVSTGFTVLLGVRLKQIMAKVPIYVPGREGFCYERTLPLQESRTLGDKATL